MICLDLSWAWNWVSGVAGARLWRRIWIGPRIRLRSIPRFPYLTTTAWTALFEVIGELGGVLGGVALQLSRIGLDRSSVHTKDHRYLRKRLPRAAFQERLGLLVRLLILFKHVFLGARDILGTAPDQSGSNPRDLRLPILDGRRFEMGRASSVRALTHPCPAVEDAVRRLTDCRRAVIVQFEFISKRVRAGAHGRLRVFRPHIRLKQKLDEKALRPRVITPTTDMRQRRYSRRLGSGDRLQQPRCLLLVPLRPPFRKITSRPRACYCRHSRLPRQSAHTEQCINRIVTDVR